MAFHFHVGLPGPFSYSKRIGGGRRRRVKSEPLGPEGRAMAIKVFLVIMAISFTLSFPFIMVPLELLVFAGYCVYTVENNKLIEAAALHNAEQERLAAAQRAADAASTGEYRGTSEIGY